MHAEVAAPLAPVRALKFGLVPNPPPKPQRDRAATGLLVAFLVSCGLFFGAFATYILNPASETLAASSQSWDPQGP
jgi:hypothetical protein